MTGSSRFRLVALEGALVAGLRAEDPEELPPDTDNVDGRLAALETLLVSVLRHRGPDALRAAIEDVRERASATPPEDAKELVALAARLDRALASIEHNWDGD